MTIYQIIFLVIFIISEIIVFIYTYSKIRSDLLNNEKITFNDLVSNFPCFLPIISTVISFLIIDEWIKRINFNLNNNQKITQVIFRLPKKPEIYTGQVSLPEDKQGYISLKE